jgi:hypothetical protein
MKIKSPKDFWAGLLFIAFGVFFMIAARNYRMGKATSMGPAYFPTVLAGLLTVLGSILFFKSLMIKGEKVSTMSFWPLFWMILSLLVFGYTIKPLGMVVALVLLVFISAYAGHEFMLKEVMILSVALIIFSVVVFVKGIGLPFAIWPKFLY